MEEDKDQLDAAISGFEKSMEALEGCGQYGLADSGEPFLLDDSQFADLASILDESKYTLDQTRAAQVRATLTWFAQGVASRVAEGVGSATTGTATILGSTATAAMDKSGGVLSAVTDGFKQFVQTDKEAFLKEYKEKVSNIQKEETISNKEAKEIAANDYGDWFNTNKSLSSIIGSKNFEALLDLHLKEGVVFPETIIGRYRKRLDAVRTKMALESVANAHIKAIAKKILDVREYTEHNRLMLKDIADAYSKYAASDTTAVERLGTTYAASVKRIFGELTDANKKKYQLDGSTLSAKALLAKAIDLRALPQQSTSFADTVQQAVNVRGDLRTKWAAYRAKRNKLLDDFVAVSGEKDTRTGYKQLSDLQSIVSEINSMNTTHRIEGSVTLSEALDELVIIDTGRAGDTDRAKAKEAREAIVKNIVKDILKREYTALSSEDIDKAVSSKYSLFAPSGDITTIVQVDYDKKADTFKDVSQVISAIKQDRMSDEGIATGLGALRPDKRLQISGPAEEAPKWNDLSVTIEKNKQFMPATVPSCDTADIRSVTRIRNVLSAIKALPQRKPTPKAVAKVVGAVATVFGVMYYITNQEGIFCVPSKLPQGTSADQCALPEVQQPTQSAIVSFLQEQGIPPGDLSREIVNANLLPMEEMETMLNTTTLRPLCESSQEEVNGVAETVETLVASWLSASWTPITSLLNANVTKIFRGGISVSDISDTLPGEELPEITKRQQQQFYFRMIAYRLIQIVMWADRNRDENKTARAISNAFGYEAISLAGGAMTDDEMSEIDDMSSDDESYGYDYDSDGSDESDRSDETNESYESDKVTGDLISIGDMSDLSDYE